MTRALVVLSWVVGAGAFGWPATAAGAGAGAVELSKREAFREAVRARDVVSTVWRAPAAYSEWWRMLLAESPEHVIIETLLVAFLVYLASTTRRARKNERTSTLTERALRRHDLIAPFSKNASVESFLSANSFGRPRRRERACAWWPWWR